jgi:hypothetical protein
LGLLGYWFLLDGELSPKSEIIMAKLFGRIWFLALAAAHVVTVLNTINLAK